MQLIRWLFILAYIALVGVAWHGLFANVEPGWLGFFYWLGFASIVASLFMFGFVWYADAVRHPD